MFNKFFPAFKGLSSIKTLASRHLHITLECLLLGEPSDNIKDVWRTLATDDRLSNHVIDYFVDVIVRQPPSLMQHSVRINIKKEISKTYSI